LVIAAMCTAECQAASANNRLAGIAVSPERLRHAPVILLSNGVADLKMHIASLERRAKGPHLFGAAFSIVRPGLLILW
jgi:hypothetical protein